MADIFNKAKRSEIMSRIRSSGTKPERLLHAILLDILGRRRRVDMNCAALPGQPDAVMPSLRLAIFADGCFYHCCPQHGHFPKSNGRYWTPKLQRNVKRDAANRQHLRRMGFSVWRIWEHELRGKNIERTYARLQRRIERLLAARVDGEAGIRMSLPRLPSREQ